MSLINMLRSQQIELVAKLLGYGPADTWPMDVIDRILNSANDAAERRLAEEIDKANMPPRGGERPS